MLDCGWQFIGSIQIEAQEVVSSLFCYYRAQSTWKFHAGVWLAIHWFNADRGLGARIQDYFVITGLTTLGRSMLDGGWQFIRLSKIDAAMNQSRDSLGIVRG